MIGSGRGADALGIGMLDLFQRPRGRVQTAPGVTTRRKPRPPIADVFEAAGGQEPALEFVPVLRPRRFADDPVAAFYNAGCRSPQPGLVARKAIVFRQHPENPAVVLIVAAGLVTARAVQDALLRREGTRQRDRALVMQPGVETILRFFVVTAPIQVHDHHARFVAVRTIAERANPREAPIAARFTFTVHQEMHRVRTVEFIEHRFGSDELRALVETATPVVR